MKISPINDATLQSALSSITRRLKKGPAEQSDLTSLAQHLRNPGKRYWQPEGAHSAIFKARFPEATEIVKSADLICRGEIIFWHPWHMETSVQPEKVGKKINWLNVPNGDDEWRHSLMRFFHIFDLAAGFCLNNNPEYLEFLTDHLASFADSRKKLLRSNKTNRLDAAVRLFNLVKAFDLIKEHKEFPDEAVILLFSLILEDADFLCDGLGQKVGNWEFFIVTSLLTAADYLANLSDTERWHTKGLERLKEISVTEILSDGMLIEKCPMYHGEVILTLLDYIAILKVNDIVVDRDLQALTEKMIDVLISMADPQGKIPQIGDSDAFDIEYIINFRNAILGDIKKIDAKANTERSLITLPATGWTIRRWKTDDNKDGYLLFDFAARPPERRYWHSHADELQFLITTSEGPFLIDPGRFTYAPIFRNPIPFFKGTKKFNAFKKLIYHSIHPRFKEINSRNWRRYFRSSVSHNTISPDGNDFGGYEAWNSRPPEMTVLSNHSHGPLLLLGAKLTNFKSRSDEVQHTQERYIIGYLPDIIAIYDIVIAPTPHQWLCSCHLGADRRARLEGNTARVKVSDREHHISFHSPSGAEYSLRIDDDWLSPFYNTKIPAQTIRAQSKITERFSLLTVISMQSYSNQDKPFEIQCQDFEPGDSPAPLSFLIKLSRGESELHIGFNASGVRRKIGLFETDALLAIDHIDRDGKRQVGFLQGRHFSFGGKHLQSDGNIIDNFPLEI